MVQPLAGQVTTFRTLGNAAVAQTLLTAEIAGSTDLLAELLEVLVWCDPTVVLTAVMPIIRLARTTGMPTGGTPLQPVLDNGAMTAPSIVFRGATASDGGAATPITATLGAAYAEMFTTRLHTAVGQVRGDPMVLYRHEPNARGFAIWPGAGAAVQVVSAAGTSNPATTHWIAQVRWAVGARAANG